MRSQALFRKRMIFRSSLLFCLVLTVSAGWASATEVFLRADTTTMVMPDGRNVEMWGFALDSSFGALDGTVMVPGPTLEVALGEDLIIHLDNNLDVPVSIVIPGQITTMIPVKFDDGTGRNRVMSFTHETSPDNGAPVDYVWTGLKPGTFIYHSGTHPGVQVQMGLYGCVKKDAGPGLAYAGVPYENEIMIFYSEIDPDFHDAVEGNNYGPGQAVTSPITYNPKYFLVNGKPFQEASMDHLFQTGNKDTATIIRFLNAGLQTHYPVINGLYMDVVAEDGFLYNHRKSQFSLVMPALKTKDVILDKPISGTFAIFDRRLSLTNNLSSPGGLLSFLTVYSSADFDGDGIVNLPDLYLFSLGWNPDQVGVLSDDDSIETDINGDGRTDFKDFAIMALDWLKTIH